MTWSLRVAATLWLFAVGFLANAQQDANGRFAVMSNMSGSLSDWWGSSSGGAGIQDATIVGRVQVDNTGAIVDFRDLSGEGLAGNAAFRFKARPTGRLESRLQEYTHPWAAWFWRYSSESQVLTDVQVHHPDRGGHHGVGTIAMVKFEYGYNGISYGSYTYTWIDVTYLGRSGSPGQMSLWASGFPPVTSELPANLIQRPLKEPITVSFPFVSALDALTGGSISVLGGVTLGGQWMVSPQGTLKIPRLSGTIMLNGTPVDLVLDPARDIAHYEYSYASPWFSYEYEYTYVPCGVKVGTSGQGTGMIGWFRGSWSWGGSRGSSSYSWLGLSATTEEGRLIRLYAYASELPKIGK